MPVKKIGRIILALCLCASMVFAQGNKVTNKPEVPIYSEDKSNIAVLSDQPQFIIQLKSNPSTGYSWFLREYDRNLFKPIKHEYQKPDSHLMGAGGYELWTFQTLPGAFAVPQQSSIRFVYARPWQGVDNSSQVLFRITTKAK